MSIYFYTGTPGSGKSYETVRIALANLKRKIYVIANFPLRFTRKQKLKGYEERFFYVPNDRLTVDFLVKFSIVKGMFENRRENQCMVILDESGGKFNSRDFGASDRSVWCEFFRQHMKLGFDFILVTQIDRIIDRQIRGCVETHFIFRNINRFGPFFFLPFKVFVKVEYWYGVKQRVGAEFILFRKKIANQYDRFRMFDGLKMSGPVLELIAAAGIKMVSDKTDDGYTSQSEFLIDNDIKKYLQIKEDLKAVDLDICIEAIYNIKDADKE